MSLQQKIQRERDELLRHEAQTRFTTTLVAQDEQGQVDRW